MIEIYCGANAVAIEVVRCRQQSGDEVLQVGQTLGCQRDDMAIWDYGIRSEAIVVRCNRQDFF
jgi:hypothetical protein